MLIDETTYEVRSLRVEDIGYLSEILDKMDFNLSSFMKDINPDEVKDAGYVQRVGMEVIMDIVNFILRKYHLASKEMDAWLASLIGVKPNQLKVMPITTPMLIFKELAEEEDLVGFFKSAVA